MTPEPLPTVTTREAADQDGYDGGHIASDGTLEAWGETAADALGRLWEMRARAKKGPVRAHYDS